jgi:hypothetical protein
VSRIGSGARVNKKPKQKYAVWISDEAARAFLGMDPAESASRWVILGKFLDAEETGVGFWLRIDHVEQWTGMGETVARTVQPPECLILWAYVITIPALEEFKDLKVNGFKQ